MIVTLWGGGLLLLCLSWAFIMDTAMHGPSRWEEGLGSVIGMGGTLFVSSAVVPAFVLMITRSAKPALWSWTIAVLAGMALLGIGGVRMLRAG